MPIFHKPKAKSLAQGNAPKTENEKGSMTIFGLGMTVGIVAAGGIALDTMYYESKRVATQDALDRCSVMAALAQNRIDGGAITNRTAQQVASDCMSKSAAGSAGLTTNIATENSGRSATLAGNYTFMSRQEGSTDSQSFAISSKATQTLPKLELTVAIDISHRGNWLLFKDPLIKFLKTVTAPDTGRKVSINIVPYGKNVILGPTLMARFNTRYKPPFSTSDNRSCLLLPESNKDDIEIDMSETYNWSWPLEINSFNYKAPKQSTTFYYASMPPQLLSSGLVGIADGVDEGQVDRLVSPPYLRAEWATMWHGNCHYSSVNNAPLLGGQMPRTGDTSPGQSVIDKLNNIVPVGNEHLNTSYRITDANSAEGIKWALAAMDPSLRTIFTQQVGAGLSPTNVSGRPLDYGADDSLKVLIFITNNIMRISDGSFDQDINYLSKSPSRAREIKPEYLDGSKSDPDIWRVAIPNTNDLAYRYSIYHSNAPGPNKYWVTDSAYSTSDGFWASEPFKFSVSAPAQRQTWRQVFERMTVEYLIQALYITPMSKIGVLPNDTSYSQESLSNRFTYIETDGTKVMQYFDELCQEAKEEGVIIYTLLGNGTANISNQTAWNTQAGIARTKYSQCATSAAHSFSTSDTKNINSALRLISSSIAQLTLTQ